MKNEEINSVEDFAKLKEIMNQSKRKFHGYEIALCFRDGNFWITLSDEVEAGYFCCEGTLDCILNYLLDV